MAADTVVRPLELSFDFDREFHECRHIADERTVVVDGVRMKCTGDQVGVEAIETAAISIDAVQNLLAIP